jgi:3-hydroxyisobutyrate dehydrogenase
MLETGFPQADVEDEFRRARRHHALGEMGRRLRHQPAAAGRLRTLDEAIPVPGRRGGHYRGLQTIRLDTIAGTAEPRSDFDRYFRPTSDRVRERWEQVAMAQRRGAAMPPIEAYRAGGLYFVSDGHHRVSIAAATGQQVIDAYVTEVPAARAAGTATASSREPARLRQGAAAPGSRPENTIAQKENQMATADGRRENMRVAVLGTGIMGSAMARNLAAAGLPTTVWDRSPDATAPAAEAGALVAASAAAAVRGADVVITMLPTAEVVSSVIFDSGAAEALGRGAVWAQMGTIGLEATAGIARRLGELRPDVLFVDAPVSGSKGPAQAGQLLILASGPPAAAAAADPVFAVLGRKTAWLGDAGQGSAMKLAVNAYMSILIEGVAEALELAARLGIDDAKLAECIAGGPLDAPIADAKLHKMEHGDYAPEFPLAWALKDVDLAAAAAGAGELPLVSALSRQWHAAVAAGHGREDISAARLALGRRS